MRLGIAALRAMLLAAPAAVAAVTTAAGLVTAWLGLYVLQDVTLALAGVTAVLLATAGAYMVDRALPP